jgi:MFS family permease
MIPSMFGPGRRQLANSLFAVAAMSGGGLGIAAAGQIVGLAEAVRPMLPAALAGMEGWRLSFFIAAAPAPLFVLLVMSIRAHRPGASLLPQVQGLGLRAAASILPYVRDHRRTFLTFFGGQACYTLGFGALTMWLPVILVRHLGQTAEQVGLAAGIVYPVSTAIGFCLTVLGLGRLTRRYGDSVPIRLLWLGCAVGVLNGIGLVLANSAMQIYLLATVTFTFQMAANMTYPTALQSLAPTPLRARAAALQGIMATPIGALATPAVGFVSDLLGDVPHGLQIASALVGVPALLLGLVLYTLAARPFAATAAATRATDAAAAAA